MTEFTSDQESVTRNTQEAHMVIEDLKKDGVVDVRILRPLELSILNGQFTYNSIGTVSKDVKALTGSINAMSQNMKILMEKYETEKVENITTQKIRELNKQKWETTKQVLTGILLISSTVGVLWAIFRFMVQNSL